MANEELYNLLSEFWDWMHDSWYRASYRDGCSHSNCDESFKEYIDKFLKQRGST